MSTATAETNGRIDAAEMSPTGHDPADVPQNPATDSSCDQSHDVTRESGEPDFIPAGINGPDDDSGEPETRFKRLNVTRNQELVLLACRHCCGDYFTNQNTAKLAAVFALMLARHKMDRPRVELQIEDLIAAGVIELLHKDSGTRVRLTTEACRILGGGSAEPQIPLVPYWELEQEQRQALKTSPKRFREWYLAWLSDPAQRDAVMRNGRDWSPVVVAIVDTAIDMSEIDAIQIERLFKRTAERGFSRQETQRALGELAAVEKIAFRRGQSGRVFVLLMNISTPSKFVELDEALDAVRVA